MPTLEDFWPISSPCLADFYPDGFVFPAERSLAKQMNPQAGAVLIALAERLKGSLEAEIELLTIMEFCEILLRQNGVKIRTISEREEVSNVS